MKLPSHEFQRIVVVGTSCAGKSTFASHLARAIDCPRIELDNLYWGPEWEPKPQKEFRLLVSEAIAQESWVADGNYGSVRELVWPLASTVVWLNYSFPRVLWQAIKRTVARCVSREILWHGNRESVRLAFFSKQSILVWVATTYHRRQSELAMLRASNKFSHMSWVEVRHPAEARELLASLRISVIVDAHFSLIVDGETASSRARRGGAQARGVNVAQSSTISLKRRPARGVSEPVLGLN